MVLGAVLVGVGVLVVGVLRVLGVAMLMDVVLGHAGGLVVTLAVLGVRGMTVLVVGVRGGRLAHGVLQTAPRAPAWPSTPVAPKALRVPLYTHARG